MHACAFERDSERGRAPPFETSDFLSDREDWRERPNALCGGGVVDAGDGNSKGGAAASIGTSGTDGELPCSTSATRSRSIVLPAAGSTAEAVVCMGWVAAFFSCMTLTVLDALYQTGRHIGI